MSAELEITFQGSATLYAIIRRQSDSFAWDVTNTAFETWDDGSIDDYDVALTSKGGDLYQADFPTDISAGNYRITYYKQAGGTAAITDLLLTSEEVYWTGSTTTASGSITIDSDALTTLASVKRYLGETGSDNDDLLTELINQISDKIERYADRNFAAANYREWLDVNTGANALVIKNAPIIYVDRVAYGDASAIDVTYSGAAIRANVQVTADSVRLRSTDTSGTVTTTNLAFTTYGSTSAMVTAISAVSGWTATLRTNVPSDDLAKVAGRQAKDVTVSLGYPDSDVAEYTITADSGILHVSGNVWGDWGVVLGWRSDHHPSPGRQSYLVDYRGGYETIPGDVALVANEMVAAAFRSAAQNEAVNSETIGDYSYTLASRVEINEQQMRRLAPYCRIAVAGALT